MSTESPAEHELGPAQQVAAMLEAAGVTDRAATELDAVAIAYANAMCLSQMIEVTVKLVVPSLEAPMNDDEASSAMVLKSIQQSFNEAIKDVELRSIIESRITPTLRSELHEARKARNHLAHGFWLRAVPAVVRGGTEDLLRDLAEMADRCERLNGELMAILFDSADRRGVGQTDLELLGTAVVGLMGLRPEVLGELDPINDAEEILARAAAHFGGASTSTSASAERAGS